MSALQKLAYVFLVVAFLAGCSPAAQPVASTPTQQATNTAVPPTATTVPPTATSVPPTQTAAPSATPADEGVTLGPDKFPTGVNPLTGLKVEDATRLERRPIIVKVQNIPRSDRPQYGLSLADIIYEYYTEEGSTRFSAIYYGQDAEVVAPIRSGRFFDIHLIRMYDGVFVFGSAYYVLRNLLFGSEFADRLLIETSSNFPAVTRFDPNNRNYLSVDTSKVEDVLKTNAVNNARQDLAGMAFADQAPAGGETVDELFVRYSIAIYNRWEYDEDAGGYLRFSDTANAVNPAEESYEQLTDALTEGPIVAQNVVMIVVPHEVRDPEAGTEVIDMQLLGRGTAYIARDGKIYEAQWQRLQPGDVLTLVDEDGEPFPFKPGQTWFEIVSRNTKIEQDDEAWRFNFVKDW